ncbi:perforin 1.5 [Lepisosteus oculatus]|nr:PREDICTED: perforin-1-like [Lepisosteus oculatus]XP_015209632.1 PREDICTED: perforin-1-like [Lepisosteus oculatus]
MALNKHRQSLFICLLHILAQMYGLLACRTGNFSECDQAPFVPGYDLAGEGFDVVKMQHKGSYMIDIKTFLTSNGSCTLCENQHQEGKLQKLPVSVLDWRSLSHCRHQLSSGLFSSVESVIKNSISSINNNWGVGLELNTVGSAILGGSQSNIAHFALSNSRQDRMSFAIHEVSCKYYSYRLTEDPQLTAEFSKHIRSLPQQYDSNTKPSYRRLIDIYGTHYIRNVQLGGRVRQISAIRTCLASLNGHSLSEIKECLGAVLSIGLGINANGLSSKCRSILQNHDNRMGFYTGFMTHMMEVMGGKKRIADILFSEFNLSAYSEWLNSLKDSPDIFAYSLYPLHELVRDPVISANLKTAVREYIQDNSLPTGIAGIQPCVWERNMDYNCCPRNRRWGKLEVFVYRASDLFGDYAGGADGFVKMWYDGNYRETHFISEDNNPFWLKTFIFDSVEIGHALVFEVWDKDIWQDDLLGSCRVYPTQGSQYISCPLDHGTFHFRYTVKCQRHLSGTHCEKYQPSTS